MHGVTWNTDRAGTTQPLESLWNAQGYGNNGVHRVGVTLLPRRERPS